MNIFSATHLHSLTHLCIAATMLSGCAEFLVPASAATSAAGPSDAERREAYVKKNAALDPANREAILKGGVREGMSEADVNASLGRPSVMAIVTGGGKGDSRNEYDKVSYGTRTSYDHGHQSESKFFSGVRITTVIFSKDHTVMGANEEVLTRSQLMDKCMFARTSGTKEDTSRYCERSQRYNSSH